MDKNNTERIQSVLKADYHTLPNPLKTAYQPLNLATPW